MAEHLILRDDRRPALVIPDIDKLIALLAGARDGTITPPPRKAQP